MEGSRALFGRGLGRVLGEVWRLWRPSWAVLESLFSMLAFGVVFKVLLEASGLDAGSILRGLGRILGGFWEGLRGIFERSGRFWSIIDYSQWLGCFWLIFARFLLVLPAACCCSADV